MGDAVLRVRGHLLSLARDNWSALEDKHAHNVTWLRDELAQISRSLEVTARFEPTPPVAPAPYPIAQEDAFEATGPAKKKQKIETRREDAAPPADAQQDENANTRLSMRLRPRAQSVDVAGGQKKTRKRGRPSEALLKDPGKLKVVQLRLELKKRGLKTSGPKAVLLNRLLDALEVEQKEEGEHMKQVEEEKSAREQEVIVIEDDDEDEIVRESVGSNKSARSFVRSQSTSPKAPEEVEKDVAVPTAEESAGTNEEDSLRALPQSSKSDGDASNTGRSSPAEATPSTALDTAEIASQEGSASRKQQQVPSKTNAHLTDHGSRHGVEFADSAEELITHDEIKWTRKSMQVSGKSELSSPLAWKRKSILRKASSLAPSTQSGRKVNFAPNDKVDMIVESSQSDSTQPDPSPEKAPSSSEVHTLREGSNYARSDSIPEVDAKQKPINTPVASSSAVTTPEDPPTRAIPDNETEEQRRKREFDENVQREAQKLRAAAKLSAQKRLEEAKASKAFWAKRDQLKAKLRASSAGEKRKSAHTPVVSSEKAFDQISPSTSTATESSPSASDTNRLTTSASKQETRAQHTVETTREDPEEAKDHDFMRLMSRQHAVESISDVSSTFESLLHESKAPRSTYSVVEEKQQAERSKSHRIAEKPAAKSMPSTVGMAKELSLNHSLRPDVQIQSKQELHQPVHKPSVLSGTTEDAKKTAPPIMQVVEPESTRDRSDSLSSTVSSIPEPSAVENALKSGAAMAANGNRRPIVNLVTGLRSLTTLLEKDNSHESNSGRSAPVVNALKLAERSRVAEEKKRLEKERRKAILKKKMEEHKKAVALKEKAEKDAQAKREQDRLNERKKREAELARSRQQKLKAMRAGLEKKRAMLAAEKKSAALASKSANSATAASHHKHRGLASASEASQPTAKPMSKPVQKPVSKAMPKPASSKPAPVSKPAPKPVSKKPTSRPPIMSPVPAKHAPKSHSPEIVNYEMSDNAESSDGDSSASDSERHGKKKVPRWAQKDHLNKILHAQFGNNAIDPSPAVFHDFVDTCNLETIFETTDIRKKKKFVRRTSSGNWLADRPTARDRALYQREMGYDR
ncbi:hypothetical protein PHYPSEUDO_011508 [Phytophthora pseudosyringae]|uniref:SAP domain-containing protein n=1 Tax=Phytophthora pseudosyringae TaxID=221518 RepID=A0A8T1V987_9STRA|nr:hypothetical protein PHYPSEUDO_011508 [Phytophthora pseudosyringae]